MSASMAAVETASAGGQVDARLARIEPWRAFAYIMSTLLAIAWTLALGKDVHWDALNYHLYLGFSAVHDRFALDFFAAGPPSYINPYAYVPLYAMTAGAWPAIAIAIAFAAFHSIVLWLTFEIALVAGVREGGISRPAFALLAVLLAMLNPVLLQGVGSTMTDLSTGVLVLAGWLAIARALRAPSIRMAALAGVLCGAAAALKLSNAVFAAAAVPALLFASGHLAARLRTIASFCVACGIAFCAVASPWSWSLWQEFRNPVFPFLNQIFASPDFTPSALRYERFIPSGVLDFLARPFEMVSASSTVHTEPRSPDVRYVVLLGALGVLALARSKRPASDAPAEPRDAGADRVFVGLLVGFAVAWCGWLAISGNSRYFMPMSSVAAALLALAFQRLNAIWHSATVTAILFMIAGQAMQLALGTDLKRDGGEWEGPWLRVEVPQRLKDEPNLYLSAGFLSGSAFLPYVHPRSGMINIAGFNIIAPGHPGWSRADALMRRNADRLRLMIPLPPGIVDRASLPSPPEALSVFVRRLGLRIDGSDCEFMRVEGNVRGERRPVVEGPAWKYFLACRLIVAPEERAAYERAVKDIDPVFDRVEDVCPNLFHPRRPPTQEYRYLARTYHMGSEIQLFIDEGRVKYFFPLRGGDPIDIGSLDAWRHGPQPIDCSVRTLPTLFRR